MNKIISTISLIALSIYHISYSGIVSTSDNSQIVWNVSLPIGYNSTSWSLQAIPGLSAAKQVYLTKQTELLGTIQSERSTDWGIGGTLLDNNGKSMGQIIFWNDWGNSLVNQPNRLQFEPNLPGLSTIDVSWNTNGDSPWKISNVKQTGVDVSLSDGAAGKAEGTESGGASTINFADAVYTVIISAR